MKTGSFVRIFQADFELLFLLIIELKLFSNIPRNVFVSFMYKSKVSGMSAELISNTPSRLYIRKSQFCLK